MLDVASLGSETSTPNYMVVGRRLNDKLERIAVVESKVFGRGTLAVDGILGRISGWVESTCYGIQRTQSFAYF
jgi:hypothetical protein